ncbi:MAG: hypothetical protein H6Q69_2008 [Firmicutes bacterium]|jgi:multidrug resistance efflux pump|nr:hypothetical protein [Bacillota bacterium]
MTFESSGFIASQEKFFKVKKRQINWNAICTKDIRSKKLKQELQESKKKIKMLETELAQKEKVLAEIKALLKLAQHLPPRIQFSSTLGERIT